MKTIVCLIISAMLIVSTAYAEDDAKNQENLCAGTWTLQYYGDWSVRNADKLVLPLSQGTIFFDCQKNEFRPGQDLHGYEVEIECLRPNEPNNLPDVTKVFFICR